LRPKKNRQTGFALLQSARISMAKRSRRSSGFYDTIEYIGPRPQKPKRRKPFGGWVILAMSVGVAFLFGRHWIEPLKAAQSGPTPASIDDACGKLAGSAAFGDRLAVAALDQTKLAVDYDESYYPIAYPNGDVPAGKGKSEDVVVRGYRALGIDLQRLVHEDMEKDFREYPQLFGATGPDANIDHRRAANLQRFFERHGETLTVSKSDLSKYQPGDVVIWTHPGQVSKGKIETRIGIVAPGPEGGEPWVVHNNGAGPVWENCLMTYQIVGHYRFSR
jgi:uncharacterized protein YijF (DUF1287 family)